MFGRNRATQRAVVPAIGASATARPADDAFEALFMKGEVPPAHLWTLTFYRTPLWSIDPQMLEHGADNASHYGYDVVPNTVNDFRAVRYLAQLMAPIDEHEPVTGEQIGILWSMYQSFLYGVLLARCEQQLAASPQLRAHWRTVADQRIAAGEVRPLAGKLSDDVWFFARHVFSTQVHQQDGSLRIGFDPVIGKWNSGVHVETLGAFCLLMERACLLAASGGLEQQAAAPENLSPPPLTEAERLLALIKGISEGFVQVFSPDPTRWFALNSATFDRWLTERVAYLMGDGWDAASAAGAGQSADVIWAFAADQMEAAVSPSIAALGTTSLVANTVNEGFVRAGFLGWLVGYAWWEKHGGWQPRGWDAVASQLMADATSALRLLNPADLPDEVFYELENYAGQTVYGWTLKELGVPADAALVDPDFGRVIRSGNTCIYFGWAVAQQQRRLGW